MTNSNTIENIGEITPNSLSDHSQDLQAEFVESSFLESVTSDAKEDTEDNELVHIPWREEMKFQEDILHATNTITFDRVFTKRARPTRQSPQDKNGLEQLLTPWGIGALFCFLLANSLLTWSQFSLNPIPTAIAPQLLPNVDSALSHSNLVTSDSAQLSPENLSSLPTVPINTRPVIANLPPISPPVVTAATVPNQIIIPPQMSNNLTNALLPPSLQPQILYAPSSVPEINQIPARAMAKRLSVVNSPVRSQPTVSINPSYSSPRSLSTIPLPPPPPLSTTSTQNLPAPSAPNISTAPTTSDNTSAITNANEPVSEQVLRQIPPSTMEVNSAQTVEGFNQKTRKKLQTIYNQNQGVSTNSESTPADANNLVQQLQQLNQPE